MKFYGQFDPPVDKFIFYRYFKQHKEFGTALECGAFDGQLESSCKFFEESLGWQVINIEPSPPIFEQLKKNRALSKNLNLALSNNAGTATFKQVIHPEFGEQCTNSSLNHLKQHKQWLDEIGCSYKEYEVKTTKYSDLIDNIGISELDLMVLDVEGHELAVLEGMIGAKVLPKILCIEHGHLGVSRLRKAMRKLPYVFDTTSHVNSYYIHSENLNPLARMWYTLKSLAFTVWR